MNPPLPRLLAVHPRDDHSPPLHVVLDLHIPAELAHFTGHFPGLPILPGVVQVDWAVRFAREHLAVTNAFARMENLKFSALVLPDARLALTLRHEPAKARVAFSYAGGARSLSSGRIVFAGASPA